MRALQIAAAGMAAQQTRVEVISNNLANMNTTGYNARKAEFADLHYQQVARPGSINASDGTVLPTGIQLPSRKTHNRSRLTRRVRSMPLSMIVLSLSFWGNLPWQVSQIRKGWRRLGPTFSLKLAPLVPLR